MMVCNRFLAHCACGLTLIALVPSQSLADLTLTINALSADEFSFSINGVLEEDVMGDQRNWLAVKNDWSSNFGTNVDWIDDSAGFDLLENIPGLVVVENSIAIDGFAPVSTILAAGPFESWGDSIYFDAGFDLTAGTLVSGTLFVQADGLFDPSTDKIQLLSGFDDLALEWNRLEANAIPEPFSSFLFVPIAALVWLQRSKRAVSLTNDCACDSKSH